MVTRKITLLMALLLSFTTLFSQTKEEERAMEALQLSEYADAVKWFKVAFTEETDPVKQANIAYNTGIAYMKKNDPKQAESWFRKAIKLNYSDPIVTLHYAEMQKKNGKFEDAIETYQKYGKLVPDDNRSEIGIESCEMAAEWIEHPTRYEVENMPLFNSKDMDFSPAWGKKDYRIVYFSSTRSGSKGDKTHSVTGYGFTDLYSVVRDRKGKWSEPTPIAGETVNTEDDEGASSLNVKGSTMYFTRCKVEKNKSLGCAIYQASKRGSSFSEATLISFPGSENISYGHPAISKNELTLYFAADLPGGYGGNDIWMMKKAKKNGKFGEPVNLGPEINTAGNEVYPYIRPDGTLYFSSDYHPGMGGLDIFKAEKDKKTGKYKVSNMRYPINSPADDFGIIFMGKKEQGYLTSSRPGGKGAEDIYEFKLPPLKFTLKGIVMDEKSKKPLAGAKVVLTGTDGTDLQTISEADGSYSFKLKEKVDYQMLVSLDKYLNGKASQSTKGIEVDKDFIVNVGLKPVWVPIKIPNIFYEYAKADLLPESMASLDNLVGVMNDNPHITVELGSHTDFRGSDEANQELAQRRAQSVVDYLISKGIAKDRLVAKGYGENSPATVSKEDAKKHDFLKENDTLSEDYINKLASDEQKEVAHQLNRRTELKVLRTDYKAGAKGAVKSTATSKKKSTTSKTKTTVKKANK